MTKYFIRKSAGYFVVLSQVCEDLAVWLAGSNLLRQVLAVKLAAEQCKLIDPQNGWH